jgi:hypothetical protein
MGPKNAIFGIAAAHIFLLTFPSLVLSIAITENTYKHLGMSLMLDADALMLIFTPSLTRDRFRLFTWLGVCVSFGYYRIFMDGAMRQPLMVFVGALGKLGAACLLLIGYLQGTMKLGIVLSSALPDILLGGYFAKVWLEMGASFAPSIEGKQ